MGKQDVSNQREKEVTPTMAKLDHASANQNQTAKLADLLVQGLNSGKLEDAVGKFMKNAPANVNVEVQAEMPDMKAQGSNCSLMHEEEHRKNGKHYQKISIISIKDLNFHS